MAKVPEGWLDDVPDAPQGQGVPAGWLDDLPDVPVQQQQGGSAGSWPEYAKHLGKLGLSSLVEGAEGLAGTLGDVAAVGNKYLPSVMTRPIGSFFDSTMSKEPTQPFPTAQSVSELVSSAGLQPEHVEPQGAAERYGSALVRAIPAAAAGAVTGPAKLALLSAGGGAIGGEAAHEFAPESTWAPVLGGLLGGIGTAGATRLVQNLTGAKAAWTNYTDAAGRLAEAERTLADAKQAALAAGEANDPAIVKQAQFALEDAKAEADRHFSETQRFSSGIRDTALTEAQGQAGLAGRKADQQLEALAAAHGDVTTPQAAGERVQDLARQWLNETAPAKHAELWYPVDEVVGARTPVDLGGFHKALSDITSSAGSLEPVVGRLKPKLPAELQKTFEGVMESPANADVTTSFPWYEVRKLRSALGEAMADPKTVNDIGRTNLSKLYAAVTDDLGQVAEREGAGKAFTEANAGSTRLYQLAEGPVAKLVASAKADVSSDPQASALMPRLLGSRNATDLAALGEVDPAIPQTLAAAHIRGLIDKPGEWDKLSPEAQAALVTDPAMRAQVGMAAGTKTQAPQLLAKQTKQINQAHEDFIDQLQQQKANGLAEPQGALASTQRQKFDLEQQQRAATLESQRAALARQQAAAQEADAKNNLLPFKAKQDVETKVLHAVQAELGANLGTHVGIGESVLGAFGVPPGSATLLGAAAPWAARSMYGLMTNPQSLRQIGISGLAGKEQVPFGPLTIHAK